MDQTQSDGRRFVILSLPRCGSTTLVRLVNMHPDVRCLMEPFHPRRYDGRFHTFALRFSVEAALDVIWGTWNGVKHVWEADGWPFRAQPELNDRVTPGPDRKVIVLMRRNLLRRAVSTFISRQTRFWVGTRAEFRARLANVQLEPLTVEAVRTQIEQDQMAMSRRLESLARQAPMVMPLYYEDLFHEDASSTDRLHRINSVLGFLQFDPVTRETFTNAWDALFDPDCYRLASPDVYARIPGIEQIEEQIGCNDTGWLFR